MLKKVEMLDEKIMEFYSTLKEKSILVKEMLVSENSEKYISINENKIDGIFLGNGGTYYFFGEFNEEIDFYIRKNCEIKEIISDKEVINGFSNSYPMNLLIKEKGTGNEKFLLPFENSMEKIKLIYNLMQDNFNMPGFDEFYMSLFYKNKEKILEIHAILEEECKACAFVSNQDENYKLLSGICTNKKYRGQGLGNVILQDIKSDKKLVVLCSNLKALKFYENNGFFKTGTLFSHSRNIDS